MRLRRGGSGHVVNHQPVIYNGSGPSVMPQMPGAGMMMPMMAAAPAATHAPAPAAAPAPAPAAAPAAPAAPAVSGKTIDSPMVGTFYAAPNPDAPAFVKVGQKVSADTVVCLIEAMKVFNEIKAEQSGTIEAVLVKSGQAVEFGQKLFSIKP
ncbi:MAG: acetyl-CoA carboxylase biotin carboxyl carrier protein [Planctomycetota bacterium]|nr:acetyl-CoA carboxylase biotin carboxyl carrier protein [Planctomycetota bacterium]